MSSRCGAALAALVAGVSLSACHSGSTAQRRVDSSTTRPTSTVAQTSAPAKTASSPSISTDPQHALDAVVTRYKPNYATSGAVPTPAGVFAAISHNGSAGQTGAGLVDIFRYNGSSWVDVATLGMGDDLDQVNSPENRAATPIVVTRLTGSAVPDFYVELDGADHTAAAVASDAGGRWHLVAFRGGNSRYEAINPTLGNGAIVQRTPNCVPNCAAGGTVTTTYRYNAGAGEFVAS